MKSLGTLFLPAGCWLTRWGVRLLTAVLSPLLAISVVSAQTNTAFSGFTQSFNPAVSLITLTPPPGAGLYHAGDSIGIQTSNSTPIRVMGIDGSLVYSGAVTTLHLPVGHYFVETPGDRTQFAVLPGDYGNLDMLSTDATGVWGYLDTINSAFAGTWERNGGEWQDVQAQSNVWNWSASDTRVAAVTASGRKLVYLAGRQAPFWLNANSSQYVTNLVTAYTNFVAAAMTRYGTNIYAWEIFNEPNTVSLQLGTNDHAIAPTFLALAQGAKAVRDQIAPTIKLVGPSYNSTLWTAGCNQWLHDHGIDGILDLWSWHDYDSNQHAPDQDYDAGWPPCGALTHRLLDTMGTNLLSKPSFIGELALYGTSALGCPPPNPADASIYQSGLSWYRGLCRAIKLPVMYRAQNVAAIGLSVGALFANYPSDNLEIYGFDQAAVGSALPRGPHPKTSAYLMACYWLNRSTYVDMRCPGTNVFLYAWRRADNTSLVFAWAVEGTTVPITTNNSLTATDIFGNSVAVSALTETPVVFRSSSPDASALLSNVMAALPPMNLPPVLAFLGNQSVLKNQPLQFAVPATDPDNDPITYSADSLPTGASLNPTNGTFSWIPTAGQLGTYIITFTATDARGLSNSTATVISVLGSSTDGLIDWWKFDQTSGTSAFDSVGSDPGTLLGFNSTNTPTWAAGRIGNALAFNGTNEYVNLDSSRLSLSNNFSISAWIYPRPGCAGVFFCLRSLYGVSGFNFSLTDNAVIISGQTATGWHQTYFAVNQIQDNAWSHVVVVYDKSTVEVYVNGVKKTPDYLGDPNWDSDFAMDPSGSTRIGAENGNGPVGYFFNGLIDDLRVYNRTLIAAEIQQLYLDADQPPVLAPIGPKSVLANQTLTFTVSASDPDSSNLTYSATPLPVGASLNSSTGAFSWTPSLSQTGTYDVIFSVSDGLLTNSQPATITVSGSTVLITVQANPSNGGTVRGGGSYSVRAHKQIAVTPNSGWTFTAWTDGNTQNPRTITVPPGGGTYTANLIREIMPTTSGLGITNAVMQFNNLAVAVAGDTNVFALDVGDWASNTLYYIWDFGDGDVSDRSTNGTPTHVYTNCDPYVVSVTVDDGVVSTNANFTVAVACQLTIGKLQGTLNFAKTNADKCTVKGSFGLPRDYIFAGKLVVLDVGGVTMSFTLDANGRGRNGSCTFNKPSYNRTTGLWKFNASLKNGSWQDLWATYGLVKADVLKPGRTVSLPVILVIDDQAFMEIPNLQYTARAKKSGTAK